MDQDLGPEQQGGAEAASQTTTTPAGNGVPQEGTEAPEPEAEATEAPESAAEATEPPEQPTATEADPPSEAPPAETEEVPVATETPEAAAAVEGSTNPVTDRPATQGESQGTPQATEETPAGATQTSQAATETPETSQDSQASSGTQAAAQQSTEGTPPAQQVTEVPALAPQVTDPAPEEAETATPAGQTVPAMPVADIAAAITSSEAQIVESTARPEVTAGSPEAAQEGSASPEQSTQEGNNASTAIPELTEPAAQEDSATTRTDAQTASPVEVPDLTTSPTASTEREAFPQVAEEPKEDGSSSSNATVNDGSTTPASNLTSDEGLLGEVWASDEESKAAATAAGNGTSEAPGEVGGIREDDSALPEEMEKSEQEEPAQKSNVLTVTNTPSVVASSEATPTSEVPETAPASPPTITDGLSPNRERKALPEVPPKKVLNQTSEEAPHTNSTSPAKVRKRARQLTNQSHPPTRRGCSCFPHQPKYI